MLIIKKSIIALLLAASTTGSLLSMECPLTVSKVRELFWENPEVIEEAEKWALQNIITYYENPVINQVNGQLQTAYEQELETICQQAFEFFSSQEITDRSAVVFDVDETCLSGYDFCKSLNFGSKKGNAFEYRKKKQCTAIGPVLQLNTQLKELGYKLIYISSRRDALTQTTHENLIEKGFHVDHLVLMPHNLWEKNAPAGTWKESERKRFATEIGYEIIGNFGDSVTDFEGEYNGYKVKLPNALY